MARVSFEKVGKTYPDGSNAVHDVDLDVADGEFLVLVGPSGCGKSTSLRMIAGLETASRGTIRIGDRVVNDVHPRDRDIAMVFQSYALYPHMSVRENLSFGLKMRNLPVRDIEERVGWATEVLGLREYLKRRPGELSGGQRQRVALGRAMVRKPQVFLFDEPLSNLDARLRLDMRAELRRLHRELGTTTIYVTHDQEEAMTLGDRIAVMCRGKIRQCGTPYDVYREPVERFVAGFLGTPPMNFIAGRVDPSGELFSVSDLLLSVPGMQALRDQSVVLGVRPEHISLVDAAGPTSVEAEIDLVELLGSHVDLRLKTPGGISFSARVRATKLSPGTRVHANFDPDEMRFFATDDDGRRL